MGQKLLILTEAGDNIGLGHLIRCDAIANECRRQNITCLLFVHFQGKIIDFQGQYESKNWHSDIDFLMQYSQDCPILIDSYLVSDEVLLTIRGYFNQVIMLDDYNRVNYDADTIINPNVYFDKINYSNQKAKCYGGSEYVILRDEIIQKGKSKLVTATNQIAVMLGGSISEELLTKVCNSLLSFNEYNIVIICPSPIQREKFSKQYHLFKWQGLQNAIEICKLYLESYLVISGCGQTLHELAYLGKNVIGIQVGDDQILNQEYYLESGFLKTKLVWNDPEIEEKIEVEIKHILARTDSEFLARNFIKGNGVKNILKLIFDSTNSITWRFAEWDDSSLFFKWANDPDVRNNSFSHDKIKWEDHAIWFKENLDHGTIFLLFYAENKPIGQLRIKFEGGKGIIDYSVDASYRGRGYGTVILSTVSKIKEKFQIKFPIIGVVKQANVNSIKAFVNSGFAFSKRELIDFQMCEIFEI
ncbi:GNAT family N-acetyltransferase [Aquirufa ecclesiirivi]|uniref:GNAT family N-acetyltransferase n=1 Tax=Aquirufa ecclesiirivi TaxID=2715124 RepID=UPI003BB224E1